MTAKRGRPPIDPAMRASEMVPVRMTKAEKAQFEKIAAQADETLSGWIRDTLSKAATKAQRKR